MKNLPISTWTSSEEALGKRGGGRGGSSSVVILLLNSTTLHTGIVSNTLFQQTVCRECFAEAAEY